MDDNIKTFLRNDTSYLIVLFVVCVVTAFGLGRLAERAAITPSQESMTATVVVESPADPSEDTETVVASKNGTKYHLPWCAGAQQMNEENKIYFASRREAEAAGYTPAANCKGL